MHKHHFMNKQHSSSSVSILKVAFLEIIGGLIGSLILTTLFGLLTYTFLPQQVAEYFNISRKLLGGIPGHIFGLTFGILLTSKKLNKPLSFWKLFSGSLIGSLGIIYISIPLDFRSQTNLFWTLFVFTPIVFALFIASFSMRSRGDTTNT